MVTAAPKLPRRLNFSGERDQPGLAARVTEFQDDVIEYLRVLDIPNALRDIEEQLEDGGGSSGGGFSDEAAQEAVGNILADTPTIDFNYDTIAPEITAEVKDGSITSVKLATDAVTTGKIQDESVTAAKLATDAVTTSKIQDDAVSNAKLADMVTYTFKGRISPGTGSPEDLNPTLVTSMLNPMAGDLGVGGIMGLVPAPAAGDGAAGKVLTANGTWSLSAGSIGMFMPDADPLSPHACDDSFLSQAAFDAKWTKVANTGSSYISRTVGDHKLILRGTAGAADNMVRWCQPVPASEFTIYTKGHLIANFANFSSYCIFVSGDVITNPDTADFVAAEGVATTGGWNAGLRAWSAYNAPSGGFFWANQVPWQVFYMRLRVNGTSILMDTSMDGVSWLSSASATAGFTPTHMGLGANFLNHGQDVASVFTFFRCFSGSGSSGLHATSIGRYV